LKFEVNCSFELKNSCFLSLEQFVHSFIFGRVIEFSGRDLVDLKTYEHLQQEANERANDDEVMKA